MKPLFLVGYMGCGKSTLGRKIARRMGCVFVDTDLAVEQQSGASVVDLFQYEGEEGFRAVERGVLDEFLEDAADVVISTGGGLPTWRDNMERMNEAGTTVYLQRSAACIASRLTPYGRQKRPRLRGLDDDELIAFMTRDMISREAFYSRSQIVVCCDELSDEQIVERIVTTVRNLREA